MKTGCDENTAFLVADEEMGRDTGMDMTDTKTDPETGWAVTWVGSLSGAHQIEGRVVLHKNSKVQ